jgi:hypothetical protein
MFQEGYDLDNHFLKKTELGSKIEKVTEIWEKNLFEKKEKINLEENLEVKEKCLDNFSKSLEIFKT